MRSLLLIFCLVLTVAANAQETKTSLGFALSPSFSSVMNFDNGGYTQTLLDQVDSETSGLIGLSGDFFFQYEVAKKLFITWGLGVQNYRYRRTLTASPQFPDMMMSSSYTRYYLRFSTSVKYKFHKSFYARLGLGADILVEPRIAIVQSCPECNYSYKGNDHGSNLNEAMLPLFAGVGYEMKLSDRLNLMAELFGTAVVTNANQTINTTSQLGQRPYQLGFSLGVIRSF